MLYPHPRQGPCLSVPLPCATPQAPYWAWVIKTQAGPDWLAYFGAVILFFFLHWLNSVQQRLENPFKHGQDDINISTFRVVGIFDGSRNNSLAPTPDSPRP